MKLRRFLLRYYPPGIILEYEQGGELRNKAVDLLTLTPESDLEVLVNQVVRQEALISENRKPQLRKLLYKLVEKIECAARPCNPWPRVRVHTVCSLVHTACSRVHTACSLRACSACTAHRGERVARGTHAADPASS